jgi:5-bromo-4-chloroindolyl phosphate hydrolysis protein
MTTDILLTLLTIATGAAAISNFVVARKKDSKSEGAQEATFSADLRYIKELLQDVRSDMKEITKAVDIHSEKIAKCEEQLHSAFVRIERLEKQLDGQREE